MKSWNGKNKAVTFSFDDGITQDIRLVELFNKYGVKGTFNISSGIQTGANSFDIRGHQITRMNQKGLKKLYEGHEIASHALTHANLARQDEETIYNEIWYDKINLENMFECEVKGFAYPYGAYDDRCIKVLADCGLSYARTVKTTQNFDLQDNLLEFKGSFHVLEEGIMEGIDRFLTAGTEEPKLLYIWGHSYEFHVYDKWEHIEELLRKVSQKDDIFYGTNKDVLL